MGLTNIIASQTKGNFKSDNIFTGNKMKSDIRKEFRYEVRLKVRGFRKYKGYSDLVTTYCCSATPCYYVIFPVIGYEGYFEKWDVEIKKESINFNKNEIE